MRFFARSALYVRTPQNRTPKSCSLLLLRKIITFHRVGNDAANRLSAPRWNFGWFTKIRLKLQLRVSIARSRNPFFATFCVFLFKKRFCTFKRCFGEISDVRWRAIVLFGMFCVQLCQWALRALACKVDLVFKDHETMKPNHMNSRPPVSNFVFAH